MRRALILAACVLASLRVDAQQGPSTEPQPRAATPESSATQQSSASPPVHVVYLFSDGQMPVTLNAYKTLLAQHPELQGKVTLGFVTESVLNDVDADSVAGADVLVFDTMNQKLLDQFDEQHHMDLIDRIEDHGDVVAVGEGLQPKEHYVEKGVVWDDRARALWQHSGERNQLGLLEYALTTAGVEGLEVPDPEPSLEFGYYYPDESGKGGHAFATWEEFDAWRTAHGKRHPGAPRIALSFFKSNYYTSDMEVIDAIVAAIERRGGEAIPFFGYPGGIASERLLLDGEGKPRADAALSLLFRFADFETAKSLEKVNIPVLNLVTLYGRSEQDWRDSATGLSMFEGTFQVAVPELAGLVAPVVVGSREKILDLATGISVVRSRPIAGRIDTAVGRALRYAALGRKPNAEKRVALMYYNFPPGKAGISASYLNVAESLSNILKRLKQEGYTVGDDDLSADAVLAKITTARNVGGFAPGELEAMLAQGNVERIPIEQYETWLDALAPALKERIIADWGPPEDTKLMTDRSGPEPSLVVPRVRYGNIVLMPQPARGWGEDHEQLYHAEDLAPPHQYLAAYAWLRNGYHADAVVHVGTHGTLEWLDGKDVGQTSEDPTDALLGDLPDLYIYNVDVVGEGLVARRRGLATLVDHMVPPFTVAGANPDLAALEESVSDYDANLKKNPELAAALADEIRGKVAALGIAKDLGIDVSGKGNLDEEALHRIEEHVLEIKGQNIPYGLHSFGEVPDKAARDSTVEAIVAVDRSLLPNDAKVLAKDMDERIVASGAREMDSLVSALDGGFVPVGSGGEPIRNPDAYPTGKNFYGVDPEKIPKPASWKLGVKLADQMLADHLKKHGHYPQKVSFVIWGDETMRHEGVLESQIFYLLGTRPVWDARGKVVDVEVIPSSELGRPRVDIVIASAAEGMFNNVTLLMDKAVQKVKALEEAENYVRDHYLATRKALIARGYSAEEADKRAGVRIFDEPPGRYDLNTSNIVAASGTWDSDRGIGDDYLKKMGHGFGNGFWGEPMEDVFRMALSGTEKVVHSSSTALYGALDNDDFYMYMGGLSSAIKNLDGASPELVVTNTRDPSKPKMSTINEFIGTEFRSRYVNPTWIQGMQKEGYAGAAHMREFVEYLWGWDATATETVDDTMWKDVFDTYVEDKYKLGMKDFFEQKSPFAFQDITARMLETVRKGYWHADAATLKTLLSEYVESVDTHGINCTEVSCANPQLMEYVIEQAKAAGVPVPSVEAFQKAVEQAVQGSIPELAAAAREFIARNEAAIATRQVPGPEAVTAKPTVDAAELRGYLMQSIDKNQTPAEKSAAADSPEKTAAAAAAAERRDFLIVGIALLAVLTLWRWRYRAATTTTS